MKALAKKLILRNLKHDVVRRIWQRHELKAWEKKGRAWNPPSLYKQRLVLEYAGIFHPRVFIETGTFLGDMAFAVKDLFDEIYTIEIDPQLHERTSKRFKHRSNIHVMCGDSAELLSDLLPEITKPCLFWLDAHPMVGGVRAATPCPLRREILSILGSGLKDYVLLIDDARLFTGKGSFPTIAEIEGMVLLKHPGWTFEVAEDIIRSHRAVPNR
jgi:hypothetical protein